MDKKNNASIKNSEERNGRKINVFFLLLAFLILISGIATAVILPYIKTLPVYQRYIVTYTTSIITSETSLSGDNTLKVDSKNGSGMNEQLVFSSSNDSLLLGPYTTHPYIVGNQMGSDSNIKLEFTVDTTLEVSSPIIKIVTCNESGGEPTDYPKEKITINQDKNVFDTTITSSEDLYIQEVVISYSIRVKN